MIIMLTQCFPPNIGGIETVMSDLADLLSKHYTLEVITKAVNGDKNWDGTQPYSISRIQGSKFLRQWRLKKIITQKNSLSPIKLFITDSWKSAQTILPLAKKQRIPIIALAHGNDVLTKNKRYRAHRIRNTLNACKHVVAVSDATKNLVFELGINHCSTIHNGIDSSKYLNTTKTINFSEPNLLTIARIEPRKGHDQVIQALPKLLAIWPKLQYHIAGTGHDDIRLKDMVTRLSLQDHVTFHGHVSQQQKLELLNTSDLFVMPVRHDQITHSIEGFGISLVEAQLAGLPVLTGLSGGVNDVVTHNLTGFQCNGNDPESVTTQITSILKNQKNTVECAKKGQIHASKYFTHAYMLQQYQVLIDQMRHS